MGSPAYPILYPTSRAVLVGIGSIPLVSRGPVHDVGEWFRRLTDALVKRELSMKAVFHQLICVLLLPMTTVCWVVTKTIRPWIQAAETSFSHSACTQS